MQLEYGLFIFYAFLISMAISLIFSIGIFVLYPFTPKKVVQKYFRPPYFSEAFVTFYSGFPTVLYRGVIFARLAANPSSGKARKLTFVYKELPGWYIFISNFLFWGFLCAAFAFLLFAALMLIEFGI